MIPVCQDFEKNGDKSLWFYNEGQYVRHDKRGKIVGIINGKELPDPDYLWKARCEQMQVDLGTEIFSHMGKNLRLKPTDAIFSLFKHWQRMKGT